MNWNSFWSGLLGTAVPGLVVSLLMLYLSKRINQALERHKQQLQQDIIKFTKWHEKRLESLLAIYTAFCDYLDFLRVALYVPGSTNLDPMHEFHRTMDRQLVHLDASMAEKIERYQGELLLFWNWAKTSLGKDGEAAREKIQQRLDNEIPAYLPRLRKDINEFLDPNQKSNGKALAAS